MPVHGLPGTTSNITAYAWPRHHLAGPKLFLYPTPTNACAKKQLPLLSISNLCSKLSQPQLPEASPSKTSVSIHGWECSRTWGPPEVRWEVHAYISG